VNIRTDRAPLDTAPRIATVTRCSPTVLNATIPVDSDRGTPLMNDMDNPPTPWIRDLIGIVVGGGSASGAASGVFLSFHSLSADHDPHGYNLAVLSGLVLATLISGGFIGRRGFNLECWTDVIPSFLGSLAIIGFVVLLIRLDFAVWAQLLGFVFVGNLSAVITSFRFRIWFPPKETNCGGDVF